MQAVQESPIIQELLVQKKDVWFEEGERQATLKALNQILTIRFNMVPKQFDKQLEKLSLASLQELCAVALTVESLAEFEAKLTKRLTQIAKNGQS